jgi:hypothetical protein
MDTKKEIQEELMTISPLLAGLPKVNVFSKMSDDVHSNHAFEAILHAEKKSPEWYMPGGYFEKLPDNILSGITAEKRASKFSKANPYEAVSGYFEKLPSNIVTKINPRKTISIRKYQWSAAIAACTIALLGFFFFKDFFQPQESKGILAKVAMSEIQLDEELNQVDYAIMIEYLETQGHDVDAALLAAASDDAVVSDPTDLITGDNRVNDVLMDTEIQLGNTTNTYELF